MLGVAVMIRDKYAVRLAPEQREELQNLIRVGKSSARVTARARILLKSNDGWAAPKVAEALDVALGTVYRIKQRFTEEGLDGALWDRRQVNRHRKLDDRGEAHLIALACSPAPEGHDHWTLRLLAGNLVSVLVPEGVRKRLKKTQKQEWCIPQVSAEFVAHMEDPAFQRPVVCRLPEEIQPNNGLVSVKRTISNTKRVPKSIVFSGIWRTSSACCPAPASAPRRGGAREGSW